MIQDIGPKQFHNEYAISKRHTLQKDDVIFAFDGRSILCVVDDVTGQIVFPTVNEYEGDTKKLRYLFAIDERCFYLLTDRQGIAEPFAFHAIQVLRNCQPQELCFAAETAYHLYVWYRDNRFCGRCGHETEHSGDERALVCPHCGNMIYPRINPAVIVGVIKGDSILMTRYAGREYKGHALIAGFCEIGESVEETVSREVMEEVGLHVTNIRYYKSQPWGFESDLLMGYFCDAVEGEEIHMDKAELAKAKFVQRDEIGDEGNLSLTAEMMMYFRDHMK